MTTQKKNMSFYRISDTNLYINVYVQPKSSKSGLVKIFGDYLKIKLKAPPVDGAANKELINFFSDLFKVTKSKVEIISGTTSRRKMVRINGVNETILKKIIGGIQ